MKTPDRPPGLERIFSELSHRSFPSAAAAQAWLDRRMAEYNAAPQAELGGLSPVQVAELIDGDWESTGALRLDPTCPSAELESARFLQVARVLLETLRDEGPLPVTQAGNLTRRSVAALLERIPGAAEVLEAVRGLGSRVVNEEDVNLLHIPRVVLGLAGLLVRRKGFRITARGRLLLEEQRTGELFAELFRTFFRIFNLAYLGGGSEQPGFQATVGFSIFQVRRHTKEWASAEQLVECVLLPDALDPKDPYYGPLTAVWLLAVRLLRPLCEFGMLERRRMGEGPEWQQVSEFRKTPLFDRFVRIELPHRLQLI